MRYLFILFSVSSLLSCKPRQYNDEQNDAQPLTLAMQPSGQKGNAFFTLCSETSVDLYDSPTASQSSSKLVVNDLVEIQVKPVPQNSLFAVKIFGQKEIQWVKSVKENRPTLCYVQPFARRSCPNKSVRFSSMSDLSSPKIFKDDDVFSLYKNADGNWRTSSKGHYLAKLRENLVWVSKDDVQASGACELPAAYKMKFTEIAKIYHGGLTPKSVVHSGKGLFFAQNMMYSHNVSAYNRKFEEVPLISDQVKIDKKSVRGAPVETAFSHDGRYAWVSNYFMSNGSEPPDTCVPSQNWPSSYVYRIDTELKVVDHTIKVGAVPKYVAASPDNKFVLVTNWCSWDLSVIDTAKNKVIKTISLQQFGNYPRGIQIDSESKYAYIAMMGGTSVVRITLEKIMAGGNPFVIHGVGNSPRHLVMHPNGRYLFATLNGEGRVAKIDLTTNQIVTAETRGSAPRSMDISSDGSALYVVNYDSNTVSKIDTSSMAVLDQKSVAGQPIGITYDADERTIWVASYDGVLTIFQDK